MFTTTGLIVAAILVVFVMLLLWLTNLVGLPGNWFMLLAATVYWLAFPVGEPPGSSVLPIGWVTLVVFAVLALIGELTEFLASSAATQGAGGKFGFQHGPDCSQFLDPLGIQIGRCDAPATGKRQRPFPHQAADGFACRGHGNLEFGGDTTQG